MMKVQFLNLVNSSFLLWMDNLILSKGSGIQTKSSYFYPINSNVNGQYIYSAPYQPFIFNENISGGITMTGVYLSGSLINRGQSGLVGFNYHRGQVIFNTNVGNYTKVSGTYSVPEIQVLPLNIDETKLLFETKLSLRPKTNTPAPTGINNDSITYPAIYVKSPLTMTSEEWAFGGYENTKITIGAFVFADSVYQADCVKSILSDSIRSNIALLTPDKFPMNAYGDLKNTGTNFNYYTTSTGYIGHSGLYVSDVVINSFNRFYNSDFSKLNPDVHWSVAEFTLERPRLPRSNINNL